MSPRAALFAPLALLALARAQEEPALERRIAVPLHDGRLHTGELLRALGTAWQLDLDAAPLPEATVDLRGARGALWLLGARTVLLDAVAFERDLARDQLTLVVDRERARDVRRSLRARLARLAGAAAGEPVVARPVALQLSANVDAERPLVVLLHGIESAPAALHELRDALAARGHQVALVDYPNDAAIEAIAAQVSALLRERAPQRVALVGYSMGGLVARAVVEDQALDPGNVDRLVLIGVPNEGSEVAALRVLREAWNVAREVDDARRLARDLLAGALLHWRDGVGEAGGDVYPGSVFLTKLAARERNPRVEYRAVLGTRSLLTEAQLEELAAAVRRLLAGAVAGAVVLPKVETWLAGLDEWIDGAGDGAVSVAAGALPGVEPVLVPLDHVGLVRTKGLLGKRVPAAEHPVFARVAEWLEAKR